MKYMFGIVPQVNVVQQEFLCKIISLAFPRSSSTLEPKCEANPKPSQQMGFHEIRYFLSLLKFAK